MRNAKRTTINWTNRLDISRKCVSVERLESVDGQPERVVVDLKLPEDCLPESASVSIEAYKNQLSMRFDCGTVGGLSVDNPLELDVFSADNLPNLRLLVVDQVGTPGRLLGTIEKIVIPGSGNKKPNKRSLLIVDLAPLGNEIWKISFNDTGPRLVIDGSIPNILRDIEHNPRIFGLVVPAAFKQILTEIAHSHSLYEVDDSEDNWLKDWIDFCKKLGIDEDPRDKEVAEKLDWVERCVTEFCHRHKFLRALTNDMKD